MSILYNDIIHKLDGKLDSTNTVEYSLNKISINDWVGKNLKIEVLDKIYCIYCSRETKKTFGQGYCFPCFRKLARCDSCIVKPELCHYHQNTCRDPEWGEKNCLIKHAIYVAHTSDAKIGITRAHQKVTRWIDQGATQALTLGYTTERKLAGLIEVELAKKIKDKTNWRDLLTGKSQISDLSQTRSELLKEIQLLPHNLNFEYTEEPEIKISYPVNKFLQKAVSLNLDKQKIIEANLLGIKGQYLLFESGGLNFRKFQGYKVVISQV
jgi:hypothetical protein